MLQLWLLLEQFTSANITTHSSKTCLWIANLDLTVGFIKNCKKNCNSFTLVSKKLLKVCLARGFQKTVLKFIKSTILQAIFEITTKFNIYWRKLMWNCETGGRNSPATLRKITNIWSGWIFVLIFFPNQKRFWRHFFVFMLLNWIQRLDYQGWFWDKHFSH